MRSYYMNRIMKFTKALYFCLILIISSTVTAQFQSHNLFVEVDVSKTGDEIVKYGRIVYNEKNSPRRKYFKKDTNKAMFLDTLSSDLNEFPLEKRNTLFYIHGMWASGWSFLKGNHRKMQTEMWSNKANPNGMVVTVIWHCKLNYFENKEMALKSGKILAPLIRQIHDVCALASDNSKTNYLIHSMGHRVFEAIWQDQFTENMKYHADNIVMAGADLETNAFEDGEVLRNIDYFSKDIVLYVHNNDRVLGVSKVINGKNRLGLDGIQNLDKVSNSILQVDVSVIIDNEDAPSRLSNHIYFYTSPTVRKDIALFYKDLAKEKFPRRKKLNHPKRAILEMPQDD